MMKQWSHALWEKPWMPSVQALFHDDECHHQKLSSSEASCSPHKHESIQRNKPSSEAWTTLDLCLPLWFPLVSLFELIRLIRENQFWKGHLLWEHINKKEKHYRERRGNGNTWKVEGVNFLIFTHSISKKKESKVSKVHILKWSTLTTCIQHRGWWRG